MKKMWMKGVAACLSAALTAGMLAGTFVTPVAAAKKVPVVVLDPGHDDQHIGARFNGLDEEDIVLKIVTNCKSILEENYNVKVYTTREGENCGFGGGSITTRACLESRALFAKQKKASAFISFHINSSTGTVANGAETYSATEYMNSAVGKSSHLLAQKIQARLVKLGLANRGVKYANHLVTKNSNSFGIPAALVEHGFIRNPLDRRWFTSDAKIKKLAQADADGIAEALGLAKGGTGSIVNDEEDEESLEDDEVDEEYEDDEYYTSSNKKTANAMVKLVGIEEKDFNGLSLTWQAFQGATSYDIYRKTRSGQKKTSSFKKIASTKGTTYTDYTCETATTYEYTVRAISKKYQTKNATPTLTKTTPNGVVDGYKVEAGVYNSVNISWQPKAYATGYLVYRAPLSSSGKTGKYEQIADLQGASTTAYLDTKAEAGTTVKYQVAAYHAYKSRRIVGQNTPGRKVTTGANKTALAELSWKNSSTAKIDWRAVDDAAGYEISRSTDEDYSKFKVLGKVGSDTLTFEDSNIEESTGYSYRVRAFFKESGRTYWGAYSDEKRIKSGNAESRSASTKIAGTPKTTVSQMVAYFTASGRKYPESIYEEYGAETIEDFATLVYDESVEEGIRPEVVFAQICKETNFLQFGGSVTPEQCNFAGLGATDGGGESETFENVQTGIRAQVQHLKAYANTESLVNKQVDPRFTKVKRGCAEYVEWLGINENPNNLGWASAKNYGYSLVEKYIDVLLET